MQRGRGGEEGGGGEAAGEGSLTVVDEIVVELDHLRLERHGLQAVRWGTVIHARGFSERVRGEGKKKWRAECRELGARGQPITGH